MDFGYIAGDTDVTIYVRLRDSTTGLAKTGLAFNSAGAVCSYVLPGAARAAITLATQTVTGAHSDGGFVEVDATNCKGLYRLDLPDAAVASGRYSLISIEFDGIIEETVIVPLSLRKSNVKQVSDDATAADTLELFAEALDQTTGQIDSGTFANDAITAAVIADDAIEEGALSTNAVQEIRNAITGGAYALDTDANGRVRHVVGTAAGELDTSSGLLAWNPAWDAEVESEANDALVALHLDHLLAVDYDPAAKPGTATALLNELVESDGGVSRFTANALEQGPSGGGGVADWTADERTAIRSILGIPASGTTPDDPTTGILDTIRDAVVVVDGIVDTILVDTNELQTDWANGGRLDLLLDAAKENTDYPDGYVYLDETTGTAGTTVGTHGTPRTPASSWANANTIAVARGRKAVRNAPGATFTISSGTFFGYDVDINGGALFLDAAAGANMTLTLFHSDSKLGRVYGANQFSPVVVGQNCFLDNLFLNGFEPTHPAVYVTRCGFYDDIVCPGNSGGFAFYLSDCYNAKVIGGGAIDFDFTLDTDLRLEGWYGDLSISNMSAGSTAVINGYGKLTIAASCTGGTIKHTSHIEIDDQASGAVTTELISEPGDVVDVTGSISDKTGYALAATGLDLVVPADPGTTIPVLGTSSIVVWNGYFAAWSVNKVEADEGTNEVRLRNTADNDNLAQHSISDDGTEFVSGPAS